MSRTDSDTTPIDAVVDVSEHARSIGSDDAGEATRTLFAEAPVPLLVVDATSLLLLEANESAVERFGVARDALLRLALFDLHDDGERAALRTAFETEAPGRLRAVWSQRTQDGALRRVRLTVRRSVRAGRPAFVVVPEDVTELQQVQTVLHEVQERLTLALSSAEQGLFDYHVVDDELRVDLQHGQTLFDAPAQLRARCERLLARVHPDDRQRLSAQLAACASAGTGFRTEFRLRTRAGLWRWTRSHATVVERAPDGTPVRIVGTLTDVDERRRVLDEGPMPGPRHEATLAALRAVGAMLELRDPYTSGHERRVGALAAAIGQELGLSAFRCEGLRVAGDVHDVGKIAVPAEILSKPGKLEPAEFDVIKAHAQRGYEILAPLDLPWPVAEVARQHHERLDGSGYPRRLKGAQILFEARILAVADTVEAMVSHRPYRPGLGVDRALAAIEQGRGTGYDADAVDACVRLFRTDAFRFDGS